ncbi:hypothetical protein [Parasulfitobacter algicola]|uniref:Uncharacterized protein n=1 Tax=Parasulfitobacter algicola TaxID=2614809 RepID=A0ABX2IS83_9RHOB|nr:hypothetical protein [Sulfitobacter algicola]NSX55759.1 hypothetical protein [Sulfitobacter algicola]
MPDTPIIWAGAVWRLLRGGLDASFRWIANVCDRLATRLTPPLQHRFSDAPIHWQRDVAARHPEISKGDDNWKIMDLTNIDRLSISPQPAKLKRLPDAKESVASRAEFKMKNVTKPDIVDLSEKTAPPPIADFAHHKAKQVRQNMPPLPGQQPKPKARRIKPSFSFPSERNHQTQTIAFPDRSQPKIAQTEDYTDTITQKVQLEKDYQDTANVKTAARVPPRDAPMPVPHKDFPPSTCQQVGQHGVKPVMPGRMGLFGPAFPDHNETSSSLTTPHRLASATPLPTPPTVCATPNSWPALPDQKPGQNAVRSGQGLKDDFINRSNLEAGKGPWNA